MNLLQKISTALARGTKYNESSQFTAPKRGKRLSAQLNKQRTYNFEIGQEELRMSITQAEDPEIPNRYQLYDIYKEVLRDTQVQSQVRSAILKVTSSPWAMVDRQSKEVNQEATELLQKAWFAKVRRLYHEAEFWGHSLIEFQPMVESDAGIEFDSVKLFPREHVRPEDGLILITPQDTHGWDYRQPHAWNRWFLEAGDPYNLGLLHIIARVAIYKKYGLTDWSRSLEKWGDPMLVIQTASDDDEENTKKEEFASKFGNNGWAILDEDDHIQLLERKNGQGYQIFADHIKLMNDEISKAINGQTGTSDDRAYVGAAEVQERLLNEYTEERMRNEMFFHNEKTIPYLTGLGETAYKMLDGLLWMPLEFLRDKEKERQEKEKEKQEQKEKADLRKPGGASGSLGKPIAGSLSALLTKQYRETCCGDKTLADADWPINRNIVNKAIDRVYRGRLQPGEPDSDLWKAHADRLWDGTSNGARENIKDYKYASNAHRLHHEMKYNVHVMAAFKIHHNVLDMQAQLFEASGGLKPRSQFVQDVLVTNKNYSRNWLNTEYNLAKAQGRMAAYYNKYSERGGYFVFKTVADDRVRPDHRLLHNTTLPVDDPFWQYNWPPLAWGCRCYVIWKSSGILKQPDGVPDVEPMFRQNAGATGRIFEDSHPYFTIDPAFAETMQQFLRMHAPDKPDVFGAKIALYERYAGDPDYSIKSTFENGSFVAGRKGQTEHLDTAKIAAMKTGEPIVLLGESRALAGIDQHMHIISRVNSEKGLKQTFSNMKELGITSGIVNAAMDRGTVTRLVKEAFDGGGLENIKIVFNNTVYNFTLEDYLTNNIKLQ